jgi:integrase
MRVGDFYSLTTSNIVRDAIEYIPSKTLNESGKVARIPLTKRAKEIIERYHKDGQMSLVPLISEQHYNKAIKDMLRIAGIDRVVTVLNPTTRMEEKHPIWEVASSHMARRNFIGNLYAEVKDPDLISSMTGHVEGSKAFARYRTIDDSIKQSVLSALG